METRFKTVRVAESYYVELANTYENIVKVNGFGYQHLLNMTQMEFDSFYVPFTNYIAMNKEKLVVSSGHLLGLAIDMVERGELIC